MWYELQGNQFPVDQFWSQPLACYIQWKQLDWTRVIELARLSEDMLESQPGALSAFIPLDSHIRRSSLAIFWASQPTHSFLFD